MVKITRDNQPYADALATPLSAADGGREWAAVFTPGEPGRYELRVADATNEKILQGEATLNVLAPPTEADDLRPDAVSLATLAHLSGGEVWKLEDLEKLAAKLWQRDVALVPEKPQWEPLWTAWWAAALVTLLFGAEWWLRKREGLL